MKIKVTGLKECISSLKRYRDNIQPKLNKLLDRLSMLGSYQARIDFSNAMYAGDNDVEITVEPIDNGYQILASGKSVLFIEFGTGKHNPPHPQAMKFGYIHGTYGKLQGQNDDGWVYVGEQGNAGETVYAKRGVYHTYGNPPARAMYDAAKDMRNQILEIAREVFGGG